MIKIDKIARPPSIVPNIQQILAESNVDKELIEQILDVAKTKQNEWNLAMEKVGNIFGIDLNWNFNFT